MKKTAISVTIGILIGAIGVALSEQVPLQAFSGVSTSAAQQVQQNHSRRFGYTERTRYRPRRRGTQQSFTASEVDGFAGETVGRNVFRELRRADWLRRLLRDQRARNY